jgi:hypothetical protein
MLGSYLTRQSPSNFRGARPLAFDRNEKGRFRYFAGGFATDSLARVAVERLKITGFRNATAVVWIDGEMIDPEAESELFYRMEISGVPQLPVSVRETIIAQSRVDMVRSGENFIVSPLDGPAAVRLRAILERLKPAYPEMEAKLSKITE